MIHSEEAIDLLQRLVRAPSINPRANDRPTEQEVASIIAAWLEKHNIKAEIKEILPGRPNVIARVVGQDISRTILLESHMDTVEITGMTIDPFGANIREGRLYGRGACDAKGPLAAMMIALSEVAQAEPPPVNVELIAVIDEEYLYRGVTDLLKIKSDYIAAIVGEPTDLEIVTANKGAVRFTVTTLGRACHSSTPWEGENAIYRMAGLLSYIENHVIPETMKLSHPMVGPATLCVSLIEGGTAVNTVPDTCTIHIDRRILPAEDPHEVWRECKKMLESFDDTYLQVGAPYIVDYGMDTAQDSLVVQKLQAAIQETGRKGNILGVNYGADASKIALAGVPSVIFGPGSIRQAHNADEYIEIEQLTDAVEILVSCIRSFK